MNSVSRQNEKKELVLTDSDQAYLFQIGVWKAAAIAGTAIIGLVVTTAFATVSTLNNDHFLVVSNTDRISAIEETAVRQDVLVEQLKPITDDISDINTDIKDIKDDIQQLIREK